MFDNLTPHFDPIEIPDFDTGETLTLLDDLAVEGMIDDEEYEAYLDEKAADEALDRELSQYPYGFDGRFKVMP